MIKKYNPRILFIWVLLLCFIFSSALSSTVLCYAQTGDKSAETTQTKVDKGGYHFPDEVSGYWFGPGQFSGGNFDKTLSYLGPLSLLGSCTGTQYQGKIGESWMNGVSLGNFGGYVTYHFNDAIDNSDKNPYGIDFIIYGNSSAYNNDGRNSMGFAEPAQVWVSQDGEKWYAIAGSDHYKDSTIWDYEMTYYNTGKNISTYTNNQGVTSPKPVSTVTSSPYTTSPAVQNNQKNTVKGIFLDYDDSKVGSWAFGYGDTHINIFTDKFDVVQSNPYRENQYKDPQGDPIDISWAVDENGLPVKLDKISYVKIQNAVFKDAGSLGEKSPEINAVIGTKSDKEVIHKTKAPKAITVNDSKILLQEDKNVYDVDMSSKMRIAVETDSKTNVYINENYTSAVNFTSLPKKGVIRVILQEGTCEPQIYYLVDKNIKEKLAKEPKVVTVSKNNENEELQPDIKVFMDLEKFSLGQGFILEPYEVTVPKGSSAADALQKVLEKKSIPYKNTGSVKSQFYVSAIGDTKSNINIPDYIKQAVGNSLTSRNDKNYLGEFDYSKWSGWMYCVNNTFPSKGSSDYELSDGDVVRWQFSLYGYGSDIGAGDEKWGQKNLKELGNKDVLIRRIAEINTLPCKEAVLALADNKSKSDNAVQVLKKIDSSQSEIDTAVKSLESIGTEKQIRDNLTLSVEKTEAGAKVIYSTHAKIDGTEVSDFIYPMTVNIPFNGKSVKNMMLCDIGNNLYITNPEKKPVVFGKWNDQGNAFTVMANNTSNYVFATSKSSFLDIGKTDQQRYINWLLQRNVIKENKEQKYYPDKFITRAEFVQMLANLSGENLFQQTDEAWYYQAERWAVKNGIITLDKNEFRPGASVSGKEMKVMLDNYMVNIENQKNKTAKNDISVNGNVTRGQAAEAIVRTIEKSLQF
ncbi:MAG: S-layer homology domain-containing protein [Aminipila sp.]